MYVPHKCVDYKHVEYSQLKVVHMHVLKTYRVVELSLHSFLTSALKAVNCQLRVPAVFFSRVESAFGIHWTVNRVSPTAGLKVLEKALLHLQRT
jgi:hypothetical protein